MLYCKKTQNKPTNPQHNKKLKQPKKPPTFIQVKEQKWEPNEV